MPLPNVFISYSHKDEIWKDRLLSHLGPLVKTGQVSVWDDRRISPGSEWFAEIELAMEASSIAVCLISQNYLQSTFCTQYEVAPLLARRERYGLVLIPVLITPCSWETVHWIKPIQMLPRDGKTLHSDLAGREDVVFKELVEFVTKTLEDPKHHRPEPKMVGRPPPECVDLTRLPYTGFDLVGRDAELARLLMASRSFDTNVLTVVGWGGVGKTTLINKWLERLDSDGFPRAQRVFAWSFASEARGSGEASAEHFIHAALEWFGDSSTRGSPWCKGERLAARVAAQPSLLVLDGIECLQSSRPAERGRIVDPALATLLVELAQRNPGLCVVTSREFVADLLPFTRTVTQENIERLSDQAGRAVLKLNGVRGPDRLLEEASRIVGGQALALRLLAAHLRDPPGDPLERIRTLVEAGRPAEGRESQRFMAILDARLGSESARELLRGLSLFEGPVNLESFETLRRSPAVEGLNSHLQNLGALEWLQLGRTLRGKGLVAEDDERRPDYVELHPLVRAYFVDRMQEANAEAWREANLRLFNHYAGIGNQNPRTLPEAEPALKATYYGARAGAAEAALQVFHRQLDKNCHFWANRLGAPGAVLSALLPLFQQGGWEPVAGLSQGAHGYLLNAAATALRALGRFEDAINLFRTALAARKRERNWSQASKNAGNLAEVSLILGHTRLAHEIAKESVELARQSDDPGQLIYSLTTFADVLHRTGELQLAGKTFVEAEELHRRAIASQSPRIPPVLYRIPGLRLGEFLLSINKPDAILERIQVFSLSGPDISNEETAYGLALCAEAMRATTDPGHSGSGALAEALSIAQRGLELLRESNSEIFLPRVLLICARILQALGEGDEAASNIRRALTVSKRNSAELSLIDSLIEKARLETSLGNRDCALGLIAEAKNRMNRTGYLARSRDIEAIR